MEMFLIYETPFMTLGRKLLYSLVGVILLYIYIYLAQRYGLCLSYLFKQNIGLSDCFKERSLAGNKIKDC